MDGTSQLECRNENSTNQLLHISIEGTSARTRPFSLEEAMLRRQSKNAVTEVKEGSNQFDESPAKGEVVKIHEHSTLGDVPKPKKVSEDPARGSSKRRDARKEDVLSDRYKESLKSNRKAKHGAEMDAEMRRPIDKTGKDKHVKSAGLDYRRKANDRYSDEYEKDIHNRHYNDVMSNDVDMERERRYERDISRPQPPHPVLNNVRIKSEIDKSGLRRLDFRHMQDVEYSAKRVRRYEEPNFRKRRSRSREYDRRKERSVSISPRKRRVYNRKSPPRSPRVQKSHKRRSPLPPPRERKRHSRRSHSGSPGVHRQSDRRSASISPRAKRFSHHGHDYGGDSFSHSVRERPGKEGSETDKFGASRNGGSSRHVGSVVAGYSPRKRKTETVTKTPSPTRLSPERKVATWDQPPASTIANSHLSATKTNELSSSVSALSISKSQMASLSNIPTLPVEIAVDSVQLTQATRPKRRLYIENLPDSASDKAVIEWLNEFLRSSNGVSRFHGNSPCISCIINKEKYQAVVEFLTPEDATTALSLDGKSFLGSFLKIRRPKDFVVEAGICIGCVITHVQDADNARTFLKRTVWSNRTSTLLQLISELYFL